MMLHKDFKKKIEEYFAPKKAKVAFYEDGSGVDFVKIVHNDVIFELFDFQTEPSHSDLLNEIFSPLVGEKVIGAKTTESNIVSNREYKDKAEEIRKKYNIPEEKNYYYDWKKNKEDKNCQLACDEWGSFIDDTQAVVLELETDA